MLTERGGICDFVKVLDFGLVKAIDGNRDASLTAIGSFTGTPLYMSPETIQNSDQVDARTDIYALGAVGYYLLTGTPVFDGSNVMEILQKHVAELPESIVASDAASVFGPIGNADPASAWPRIPTSGPIGRGDGRRAGPVCHDGRLDPPRRRELVAAILPPRWRRHYHARDARPAAGLDGRDQRREARHVGKIILTAVSRPAGTVPNLRSPRRKLGMSPSPSRF